MELIKLDVSIVGVLHESNESPRQAALRAIL